MRHRGFLSVTFERWLGSKTVEDHEALSGIASWWRGETIALPTFQ